MHKFFKIVAYIGGALFCSAFNAYAQEKPNWANLHFMRQSEVWLSGDNAAGLKFTPLKTLSEIRFSGTLDKGDFINYNQANQSAAFSLQAESYYRMTERIVFFGDISYSNFTGKNRGASAWIDPEFAPFNLVEYTDTTRGEKAKETYHLSGSTAVDLSKNITVGGELDYLAANYVKRKDLRHYNMLMDLKLSPSLMFQLGKFAELGINYHYRKRVEETNFDMYGNTDRTYSTLISWGTFWGQVESFGSEGFTGEGDNNPLVDKTNGLSIQINVHINPQVQFFNQLTYNKRKGYFGIDSDETRVYSKHRVRQLAYLGKINYNRNNSLHQLCLQASNNTLENWKTNYYYDNDLETGVEYVKYNTPTKVLTKSQLHASLEYQLHTDYKNFSPKWSIVTGVDFKSREENVSSYPLYRNQSINHITAKLNASRRFERGKSQYTCLFGGRYATGNGTRLDAGSYTNISKSDFRSTDFYLYREFEYLTRTNYTVQAAFTYAKLLDKNKIRPFASLQYEFTKATKIEYLIGDTFNMMGASVGCSF